MTNLLPIIITLLLTGATTILAQSDTKEQLVIPLSEPNKPGSLDLGLINGLRCVLPFWRQKLI